MFQTATLLSGGSVLAAGGGQSYDGAASNTAELFTPVLLAVNPGSGPAGTQVTVTGSGFYAGESVTLLWDGGSVLGHARTSALGSFSAKLTIPQGTAGSHTVSARGQRSFAGASATFTVTG